MGGIKDLTGKTFGRLTVVGLLPERCKYGQAMWRCRCSCGGWAPAVRGVYLRGGGTTSCGCLQREGVAKRNAKRRTHGLTKQSGNSHYTRWQAIKQRTTNPNATNYKNYGGRGIYLHHTWAEPRVGFQRFKWYLDTVLGPCPEGMTLDRKDNDQGYEPCNLRWATQSQQNYNKRSS